MDIVQVIYILMTLQIILSTSLICKLFCFNKIKFIMLYSSYVFFYYNFTNFSTNYVTKTHSAMLGRIDAGCPFVLSTFGFLVLFIFFRGVPDARDEVSDSDRSLSGSNLDETLGVRGGSGISSGIDT